MVPPTNQNKHKHSPAVTSTRATQGTIITATRGFRGFWGTNIVALRPRRETVNNENLRQCLHMVSTATLYCPGMKEDMSMSFYIHFTRLSGMIVSLNFTTCISGHVWHVMCICSLWVSKFVFEVVHVLWDRGLWWTGFAQHTVFVGGIGPVPK